MAEIDTKHPRRLLTSGEREMLKVTSAIVETFREQLHQALLAEELLRGDLLIAQARIRVLEDELGIVEQAMETVRPERSGEMKVAEEVDRDLDS